MTKPDFYWKNQMYEAEGGKVVIHRQPCPGVKRPDGFAEFVGQCGVTIQVMGKPYEVDLPVFPIDAATVTEAWERFDAAVAPLVEQAKANITTKMFSGRQAPKPQKILWH